MIKVGVIKNWDFPDLGRQSPNGNWKWENISVELFRQGESYDLLIILNAPHHPIHTRLPEGRTWLFSQESPIPMYQWHTRSFRTVDKAFTYWSADDVVCPGGELVHTQTALPWHIGKSFDELIAVDRHSVSGYKQDRISWITSNYKHKEGQVARLKFLDFITQNGLEFDLFGKGFNPIEDKYDAMHEYKYSIAIENYSCNDYWTEKIADSFLSFCVPFYHGAKNIDKYFPKGSFIHIDPERPLESMQKMQEAVAGNYWEQNFDALCEARELVLRRYQFFPWVAELTNKLDSATSFRDVEVPANLPHQPVLESNLKAEKITVVICTRNRAGILKYCLDGFLKQEIGPREYDLLVVDNNSTDSTLSVVDEYKLKLPNLTCVVEEKTGLSHARNTAVRESVNEWVVFIDDDAIPDETFVSRAKMLATSQGFDCFGGTYYPWYLNGKPKWLSPEFGKRGIPSIGISVLKDGYVSGGISAWKKSVATTCGLFPVDLGMSGDKIAYGEETYLLNEIRTRGFCIGYDSEWKMLHLVSPEKCTVKWHLKFHFAHGRDSVKIWKKRPIVSRSIILKSIVTKQIWSALRLLWKAITNRQYYFQNFVIDSLRPTIYMYGQYKGLVESRKID